MRRQNNTPVRITWQFVPLPSRLIDDEMPRLSDTAWRVLCVVARCTLGWKGTGAAPTKESDWLTHQQLMARTGRASAAVSRAIGQLVGSGLLVVSDAERRKLPTADKRRRAGRLYFGLSTTLRTDGEPDHFAKRTPESEVYKRTF